MNFKLLLKDQCTLLDCSKTKELLEIKQMDWKTSLKIF